MFDRMRKFLILAILFLPSLASASEGYYGVKRSTTIGTAEQRLAGLFCASVSSAVWDTCTVQVDGPNTRILIGNGVNVTTITATDLYIATVTASYIWLDGVDLEEWIDSIATSTGSSAAIISELSLSTAANKAIIDTLSTSTAANKTIIDTLSVSTDANKTIIDTLSVSTDANKTIIDTLSTSTAANATAITAIEVSTGVHAGLTGTDAHGLGAADMEWAGVHTWESSGTFKSSMTVTYLIRADSVTTTGDISAGGTFYGDGSGLNNLPVVSSASSVFDSDGDTGIQTEKTADDDTIRFETGGVERGTIEHGTFTIANIANAFHLLVSTVISPVAVTSIEFSGLDINSDGMYYIVFTSTNLAAAGSYAMYINGDQTGANYHSQSIQVSHTTLTGLRENTANFSTIDQDSTMFAIVTLTRDVSGYVRWVSATNRASPNLILRNYIGKTVGTVANVTSIDIVGTQAGLIGLGSRIEIYKTK